MFFNMIFMLYVRKYSVSIGVNTHALVIHIDRTKKNAWIYLNILFFSKMYVSVQLSICNFFYSVTHELHVKFNHACVKHIYKQQIFPFRMLSWKISILEFLFLRKRTTNIIYSKHFCLCFVYFLLRCPKL